MHDIVHKVVAVGSRNTRKAQDFVEENAGGDESIKAYGTYAEVYADPNVDAVYIGLFFEITQVEITTYDCS